MTFDEPPANGEGGVRAVLVDDDLAGDDLRDQADVLGIDPHLPLGRRQRDHVHVFGEDDRLRRDDFEL